MSWRSISVRRWRSSSSVTVPWVMGRGLLKLPPFYRGHRGAASRMPESATDREGGGHRQEHPHAREKRSTITHRYGRHHRIPSRSAAGRPPRGDTALAGGG